jgi:DNA repair protein RecO (recombination protein O)
LVESFAPEDSDSSALYDLLADGLAWLCQAKDPALAARAFELRLLTLEGYRPELFKCARTGQLLEIDRDPNVERAPFSPAEGGVLLSSIGLMARDAFYVDRSTLMLLRAMQTQPFEVVDGLSVSRDLHSHAERAMQAYLSYVLERRPKSPAFIHQLQGDVRR